MCFCGSLCKLIKSDVLGDNYGMMFFMCENYEYDPPKRYGKDQAKVAAEQTLFVFVTLRLCYDSNFSWTKSPPSLCDFVQWFDTEQSQQAKDYVEQEARWAAVGVWTSRSSTNQ